jgi:hypothetical protein
MSAKYLLHCEGVECIAVVVLSAAFAFCAVAAGGRLGPLVLASAGCVSIPKTRTTETMILFMATFLVGPSVA